MNDVALTAFATVLLVVVGLAQVWVLTTQKKQTRIALITEYRQRWNNCKEYWGKVIFVGRNPDEYYHVVDEETLNKLKELTNLHRYNTPTIWAVQSIQNLCGVMGEISIRILQGHLHISDVYPIFGTEFLRQTKPLRVLLDSKYEDGNQSDSSMEKHFAIRKEIQDWLIYHDGLRRRCLILIDLLWAEAARLEDLPPHDIESAADAKKITGKSNRNRIYQEVRRLNGIIGVFFAWKHSRFLRRAEYYSLWNPKGIKKKRLNFLKSNWTNLLLRE